jgi:hypothetical protein
MDKCCYFIEENYLRLITNNFLSSRNSYSLLIWKFSMNAPKKGIHSTPAFIASITLVLGKREHFCTEIICNEWW